MDIYLTPTGGSKLIFPLLPEKISRGANGKFITFSTISLGDIKIPRGKECETYSWNSKFPGKGRIAHLPFMRKWTEPAALVRELSRIRDEGVRCNLTITGTSINRNVYISEFTGEYTGGFGDYDYNISLTDAQDIRIYTVQELQIQRPPSKREDSRINQSNATQTYTVKTGDSLWRIAQQLLGNGARYTEIFNLNRDKISDPSLIYTGQTLTLPQR